MSWEPFSFSFDVLPDWTTRQLEKYAAAHPWTGGPDQGRITIGLGFDAYYLPQEVFAGVITHAREHGVKLITSHEVNSQLRLFAVAGLSAAGLLGPDTLISHATNLDAETIAKLVASKAPISATPGTELPMQHGDPVCFHPELEDRASLGVDCGSSVSSFIPETMRVSLLYARGKHNQAMLDDFKAVKTSHIAALRAYNLGTIKGARAAGLGDLTGSLAVGKRADLVIFDATSPSMLCAAQHDPVAALVFHSTVRDVDTVVIDGVVRKRAGKLVPVQVDGGTLEWHEVAVKTLETRARIQEKIDAVDLVRVKAEAKISVLNPAYTEV